MGGALRAARSMGPPRLRGGDFARVRRSRFRLPRRPLRTGGAGFAAVLRGFRAGDRSVLRTPGRLRVRGAGFAAVLRGFRAGDRSVLRTPGRLRVRGAG
ncbi:hypothetical protein ABZ904_35510, partial [Streptomyces sp. NPDC046900]|uniref:hypothetical protein n=1 Tax=Streptomyces sp. NPDC046900 TaxID=3155473 RepID=UPI003401445B